MKWILAAVCLLALATDSRADSLKTKTEERKKDDKVHSRITRTTRHGKPILECIERFSTNGIVEMRMESVLFEGRKVFTVMDMPTTPKRKGTATKTFFPAPGVGVGEMDADRDGVFELVSLMGPKGELIDAFKRDQDGRLSPISDEELERTRKLSGAVEGMVDELTRPETKSKR